MTVALATSVGSIFRHALTVSLMSSQSYEPNAGNGKRRALANRRSAERRPSSERAHQPCRQ